MRRAALLLTGLLLLAGATGCGSTDLKVSAAASLKSALTAYGSQVEEAKVSFSFAGSDALAVQIERGAKPDVYAAANTKLPDQLFEKGLVEKPRIFAANRLVLAVPAKDPQVASLSDLEQQGIKLAVGEQSVPIGSYTRTVLGRLPTAQADAILANVRTEEPDVSGITGKLTQGAVDAGFLYVSDVRATNGRLTAIELPEELLPQVAYAVAVVKGTEHPEQARAFVDGLLSGAGARALSDAGFEPRGAAP
ncbi:MAG: molybdate ABC transporter substrate-binding protein [Solirubrobacterales bacterium]|nr:molybdate ABC transporter substrate-binding protein [Solirubrobacterales bacterium]